MKLGLVLEGGAMRGVFTAGVLDGLHDAKVFPHVCLGVSAGACAACSYLSRQRGRAYAVMTDYLDEKEYCSVQSLLRTGDLFGAEFLYHKIPEQLYPIDNETFLRQRSEFYAVVTNCKTGNREYVPVRDLLRDVDCVRASASLPLVSRMVDLNGQSYLDGGITDSIPVQQALEMGCDRVIVVLTRERGFRKSKERFLPLIHIKYRKYPSLVRAMEQRWERYNETLEEVERLEREGKIFLLAPTSPLKVRRTEKDRVLLREAYEEGLDLLNQRLSDLQKYINQ